MSGEKKEMKFFFFNPSIEEIKEKVNILYENMGYGKDFPDQKIKVVFSQEVPVRVNSRKVKRLKEMRVKFFTGSSSGNFCYSFYKRTGYYLHYLDYTKIISVSIESKPSPDFEEQRKRFLKKFHPNVWENIRNNPDMIKSEYDMKTVNIKKKFPPTVINDLIHAFDEKKDYYFKMGGTRRDLSVETKNCDDGIFRAWFSSEFAGCLNGSYYILINPTTAAFREDD